MTSRSRKGKTATLAQKKNFKNARAAHINLFVTKTIALYDYAIGNTATITINERAKRAAPLTPSQLYSDPFSQKIGSDRKLLSTNLTSLKVSAY
ncbi:hypothetical protein HBH88_031360 [Parastagonospora nodorum]|nr:hypothetical protein HBI01_087510 [Parastagonospora nodorum]KAH4319208.1 hypothetical protein HBI02_010200 [Parastagonospora nodorum]KAH4332084.1 hypothetical protein HBI00_069850 [Parastagonospora nodorum]KAH4373076.1 hypothetical protein HBH94_113280 [Parastagonospora nodorum]KAH4512786.1 hypothetical protein HBH88_031360 [Parastagonospora nodorum]